MGETLEFENFLIDVDAFELRMDGKPVAVEPLVLDLIIELTRHPGVLRTRDDLIETVWGGRIVSDTTISTAIKSARKAVRDTEANKRLIRTVRGRGFQFIADIKTGPNKTEERPIPELESPLLRIHVATLDESISPAMARALEGRLRAVFSRIPFLDIASPVGTGAVTEVGKSPNPTHLIEIALSSIEENTHADVSLFDLLGGVQKWARNFSVPAQEGIEKLLTDIGPRAEPQILRETSEFLAKRNETEPKALVLRAMQTIAERGWNPSSIGIATNLLEQATSQKNDIAIAYAITSLLNAIGYRVGMLRHDDSAVTRAIENAELALSMEGQNSVILGLTGCALCDVGHLARGEPIIDRAIELDPMNGHAHAAKGAALMMRGEFASALQPLRKSIAISPADSRLAVWGAILAAAELKCGQLEEAHASVALAISRDDVNYLPRLAAVAIHLARSDKPAIKAAMKELLRVHPEITLNEVLFFVGKQTKEAIWPIIEAERF